MARLSHEQRTKLLAKLGDFAGNTCGVDGDGYLTLIAVGGKGSQTAIEFLNELVGAEDVFNVVSTEGGSRLNPAIGIIGCPLPSPRSQSFTYTRGLLTMVTGYTTTGVAPAPPGLTYHPNGLVAQVNRSNGVTDVQTFVGAPLISRSLSSTCSG